jgi:hypothetical protein
MRGRNIFQIRLLVVDIKMSNSPTTMECVTLVYNVGKHQRNP